MSEANSPVRHAQRALELSRSTVGLGRRDVERNVELLDEIRGRREE
jgi:hypothetical protein